MADDLLILKILKLPVIVIGFLSNTFAIITYIPNYFIIYGLDIVLFNPMMYKTLIAYSLSWIPRLISLSLTLLIFII